MTTPCQFRKVEFTVPGAPVPKGRGRTAVKGNAVMVYTPASTRAYEKTIQRYARMAMGRHDPIAAPVLVTIKAFLPIPKSWSKARREAANYADVKPDLDNFVKAALDGMNGIVLVDDALAVDLFAMKRRDVNPRMEITVQPMP